ncbi:uncharacterized protein [Chelonus insularis]|uniref:uncharacterized protein n=1 Tax=Chelonus insularis TaxID=460826 RepID=UPI00158D4410|nr:uncharacterized protein LOC118067885 [Chelonus insularis]
MRIFWISTIIYIVQILTICQSSMVITITDVTFFCDPEFCSDESKVYLVNKDIKNEVFSSLTLVKSLPNSSKAHIEVLVETDGQYQILNNIDQWMPMCDLIDEPVLLGKLFRNMGFKGCPVDPGVYSNPSYVAVPVSESNYPPGNYMSRLQVEQENNKLISSLETKFKIE